MTKCWHAVVDDLTAPALAPMAFTAGADDEGKAVGRRGGWPEEAKKVELRGESGGDGD